MDWDEVAKPKSDAAVVGQNLERMSIDELRQLVGELETEILRVNAEIDRKKMIGSQAESVFKS